MHDAKMENHHRQHKSAHTSPHFQHRYSDQNRLPDVFCRDSINLQGPLYSGKFFLFICGLNDQQLIHFKAGGFLTD